MCKCPRSKYLMQLIYSRPTCTRFIWGQPKWRPAFQIQLIVQRLSTYNGTKYEHKVPQAMRGLLVQAESCVPQRRSCWGCRAVGQVSLKCYFKLLPCEFRLFSCVLRASSGSILWAAFTVVDARCELSLPESLKSLKDHWLLGSFSPSLCPTQSNLYEPWLQLTNSCFSSRTRKDRLF